MYYFVTYSFYVTIAALLYIGFFMLINKIFIKRPKVDLYSDEEDDNPYIIQHLKQLRNEEKAARNKVADNDLN